MFAAGTGLGLAFSQQLIVERGGTNDMDSVDGEGSTFHFVLRAIDSRTQHAAGVGS